MSVHPRTPPVRRPAAAGPLLVRKLRALDAELAAAIPRVHAASDDEAIHDLRVSIRRLRTLLKLARPVFGAFHADAVRAAFTVIHRATGALRDEEVLEETLGEVAAASPDFVAWRMRRRARERSLRRGVLARLRAGDLARARKLLAALMTLPIDPSRERPAPKLARKAAAKARRGVERLRDAPTGDAVALHNLRIAYKELRYATELLADALPADLAAMALPAAKFQKRLGEIHDADMAIAALRRARGIQPANHAAALRALEGLRAKRVAKYVAEMAPAAGEGEEQEVPPLVLPASASAPAPLAKAPVAPKRGQPHAPKLRAATTTLSASIRS
jgi:CHAD domain-containing protein